MILFDARSPAMLVAWRQTRREQARLAGARVGRPVVGYDDMPVIDPLPLRPRLPKVIDVK